MPVGKLFFSSRRKSMSFPTPCGRVVVIFVGISTLPMLRENSKDGTFVEIVPT
jgi:hypothetical protein